MKKLNLIIFFLFCFTISMDAQKTIAVLTGSNWTFYTDFSTALNQCSAGSTIYLPGGLFTLSQGKDTIDKQITIIGVGHYPDSTIATSKSVLNGDLFFIQGANDIFLQGIELNGMLNSILPNVSNNNLYLNKCLFKYSIYISTFSNVHISECVFILSNSNIGGSQYADKNVLVEKCIFLGMIGGCLNCKFENNIFFTSIFNNPTISGCDYCELNNNIFAGTSTIISNSSSVIARNNSVTGSSTNIGAATSINTIANSTLANTFVNVPSTSFNYNYDYHLLSTSAGKNAGTDGTDIGIYGTAYPYKPSAVPANPHISFKSISPSSAPNGTLPVNIRVIAQDR